MSEEIWDGCGDLKLESRKNAISWSKSTYCF